MKSVYIDAILYENSQPVYKKGVTFTLDKNGIILSITSGRLPGASDYSDYVCIAGYCDFHSHFPQLHIIGKECGTLLQWLNGCVYPVEKRFTSYDSAYGIAKQFFNTAVQFGTTEIFTYSTSSLATSEAAFDATEAVGIEAFIGHVLMDRNVPKELIKSVKDYETDYNYLYKKYHKTSNGRLHLTVNPRFAVACSQELLDFAGDFAATNDLIIQTHLAENKNELIEVKKLFPKFENYTDVYERFGIVTDKTLFAHCIYLSESEIAILKEHNSAIVHCPSSNIHLKSGIMQTCKYIKKGMEIAFGSDVGAGESLSMLAEMKNAVEVSKILFLLNKTDKSLSVSDVFMMMYDMKRRFGLSTLSVGDKMNAACFLKSEIFSDPYSVKTPEDVLSAILYGYANKPTDLTILNGNDFSAKKQTSK